MKHTLHRLSMLILSSAVLHVSTAPAWADPVTHVATVSTEPVSVGILTGGKGAMQAVINGKPAIVFTYFNGTDNIVAFARNSAADGLGTWTTYSAVTGTGSDAVTFFSLAEVNGRPAITFTRVNALYYVRASDADGTTWGAAIELDAAGAGSSLCVVDGYPAVSYRDFTTTLKYKRATNADGSAWSAAVELDTADSWVGATRMAIVNGCPAIVYQGNTVAHRLKYVRASDASGATWGTPLTIMSDNLTISSPSLAVVNGNPAVAYKGGSLSRGVNYIRATNADGTIWDSNVVVDPVTSSNNGNFTSLAVVQGSPAIAYYGNGGNLQYVRATDADGADGNWGTAVTLDTGLTANAWTSLVVVNGNAAVSYFSSTPTLKWASYVTATPEPEIAIEQPVGTDITDGSSSDLGSADVGVPSSPVTFTIKNTGTADLTLGTFTKEGPQSSEFAVSAPGNTTVAAGSSTTFTITFTPTVADSRSFFLHIPTNDSDEGSFDIIISGTGVGPVALPSGAVAWLRAEDNANDASGSNNHGTLNGTVPFVSGRVGKAFSFDGTSTANHIRIPNSASLQTANFSIDYWVKFNTTQNRVIVAKRSASGAGDAWQVGITHDGSNFLLQFVGYLQSGSLVDWYSPPITSPVGVWTHVAATYDGATIRGYINGDEVFTQTATLALATRNADIYIGTHPATLPFDGLVDEFQLFNRALTHSEVLGISNAGAQGTFAAPVVASPTSASITTVSATLGGNVTSDGNSAITERGVVYALTSANSDPLISGSGVTKVAGTGTTGVFTVGVSSLSPGQGYTYKAYAINAAGTSYSSAATFTTPGVPEIAVEQPVGTNIADGGSKDLGASVINVAASAVTFTIRNTGTADLTLSTFTKDGTNPTEFAVSAPGSSTVASGGSTTFTVTFTPGGIGARSAALHIPNNDADEGSFDITLTGTGAYPYDLGDLPDTSSGTGTGDYQTLSANGGPFQLISSGLMIGSTVDAETDGQPNGAASGDGSDDDGVSVFPTFTRGASGTIPVAVTNPAGGIGAGVLQGSFDWNRDGDFLDTNETSSVSVPDGATSVNLPFTLPVNTISGANVGLRLNLSGTLLDLQSTTFDGGSLPSNIFLDIPSPSAANVTLDTTNQELDFTSSTGIDLWNSRANAPIAWAAAPSVAVGETWTVQTRVKMNAAGANKIAGLTFYGGPDGAKPDVGYSLDLWTGSPRVVLQGFGDNTPSAIASISSSIVTLRVDITEGGATDTYNYYYRVNDTDAWTQLGGAALNHTSSFANSRAAMYFKAAGAQPLGASFTDFAITTPSTVGEVEDYLVEVAPSAEIAVEQPAATNIADGGSKDFGSVALGSNTALTFTIKNTGDADLTGLTITKDGTNASDFSVTANPTAPVSGPSGSTTFTVTFTPSALGARTAAIHIASNDGDENPFDINLTGLGTVTTNWTVAPWTGDSTSNVTAGQTLWGYNFGTSSSATINGVTFTGVSSGSYSDTDITMSAGALFNSDSNNITVQGGSSSALVARDFFYSLNGNHPVVKNLTVGQTYTVSFFSVAFENPGNRPVDFSSGGTTFRVDQDKYGDNNGIRVDYTFTAAATTQTFNLAPVIGGSTWHLYGMALRTASTTTLASTGASWWKAENNANDSIGTNHGTLQNGATYADGLVKRAFSLDGVNDLVSVPSAANLNFGVASDLTVEMWVKLNGSQPSFNGLLAKAGTSYPWAGYQMAVYGNKLTAEIGIGSFVLGPNEGVIGTTLLNDGYWHHVAMVVTRSAANVKLYVDGREEANITHGALFTGNGNMDNGNNLYIGVERGAGIFFKGWIDEPAIYRSALSAAQIQSIHAASSLGKGTPEIHLIGNSTPIANADPSPSPDDHTDFGNINTTAATVVRTFTIQNAGDAALVLSGSPKVSVGGTHAADFSVTAQPSSPIAAGGSATFQVTFDPSAPGTRNATLSIANDDSDENPYTFSIQGTGLSAPVISAPTSASITIASATLGGNVTHDGALTITERGIVYSATAANADPLIDGSGVTKVTASGTTGVFTIDASGLTEGTAYSFKAYAINSLGTSYTNTAGFTTLTPPEIVVTGNGEEILDGAASPNIDDHTDFGNVATAGGTIIRTFTVTNSGTTALTLGTVTIGGTNAADFSVTSQPSANLSGGGSTTFQITFNPSAFGLRTATLSFATNDADENPFNFSIQGTGDNTAPTITAIADRTINEDSTTSAISFTIGDADPGATLSVSASSDDTDLVPNGNISFGGSGANRTVTVTPAANAFGSATISVTVTDGSLTASEDFAVTVTPINDAPSFTLSSTALSVLSASSGSNGYSIGNAPYGQIAAGVGVTSSTTVRTIVNVSDFVQVSAGDYGGCGLREDGTVWVWGRNEFGQLANGVVSDASPSFVPLQVPGLSDVTKVEAGFGWFLALKSDGTVWAWGRNAEGCLGQGTTGGTSTVPVQVQGLSNVTDICAGGATSMALTSAGTVYTWGGNQNGNLGRGTIGVNSGTAAAIPSLTGNVSKIFQTKGWTYFVQKTNGEIWAWGVGIDGNFGDGRSGMGVLSVVTPFRVTNLESLSITSIRAGYNVVLALLADGTVKGWGNNGNGQIGIGSATGVQTTPVTIPGLSSIVQVETDRGDGYALGSDGRVWAWGYQNGTPQKGMSPALVTGFSNIASISAGSEFLLARGSPPPPVVGLTVAEDSAAGNIPLVVDSFSTGPANEVAQSVDFVVTNDNNTLFSVQPAIAVDGTLTYTLASDLYGTAIISVRAHDNGGIGGGGLDTSAAQTFTIGVTPVNDQPTDIALSADAIAENNAANATVGTLSTTDVDAGDTFTYALVPGAGDTDNASFTISGNALRLSAPANYEMQDSYAIRVSTTDAGSLSFEKEFTITITDVNESPVVTTPTAANITAFAADLGGDVVADSGSPITERGVVYAPTTVNSNPVIGGTGVVKVTAAGTTGVFSVATGVLSSNTAYSFKAYAINALGTGYTDVETFATPAVPEIAVEQPAGAGLASGGSRSFGFVAVNATGSLEFTIRNTGTAELTGLAITEDGDDDNEFVITANPTPPLAPGETTTFTVEFTPTSRGPKTAVLHIASNDDDEDPFDITLTGIGGEPGAALAFDGNDDTLGIAAHAQFNTATFTVEGWVKPSASMPEWSRLWGTETNQGDLIIKTGSANHFSFAPVIDGQFLFVEAPSSWTADTWYHVAGVVDHLMVRLFVNGQQVAARPKTAAWAGDPGKRYIGNATAPAPPNRVKAVIDEVRYWNYARNCDQIAQARMAEVSGPETGLVAYYKFNQGVADADNPTELTATDSSGNGHHGTLTNFALADDDGTSNWTSPGAPASGIAGTPPQYEEIAVTGNGVAILSGDTTPSDADHTDFGDTGSEVTRTFTIANQGNIPLAISSIALSGAQSGDFEIGGITGATSIAGGATAQFTVTVPATTTDVRIATVTINSLDCDEGAFTFVIQSLPAIQIATAGNSITTTDPISVGGTLNVLESGAGFLKLTNPVRSFRIDAEPVTFGDSGPIALAGVTNITVNGGGGSDTLNIGAFLSALPSLTINGGAGDDTLNFIGDLAFAADANLDADLQNDTATPGTDVVNVAAEANVATSGGGTITVRTSKTVSLASGSSLVVQNGNLIVEANRQATATAGQFAGIRLNDAAIDTDGTGTVTLSGTGGTTGDSNYGVVLSNGASVNSLSTAAGAGAIAINGMGGSGGLNLHGIFLDGAVSSPSVTSKKGAISLAGLGGTGTGAGSRGVLISGGGAIAALGDATVNVTGTGGGNGTSTRVGVQVTGGSSVTGVDGNVTITGTGGTGGSGGSGTGGRGVLLETGSLMRTTGAGAIAITGTEGVGTSSIEGIALAGTLTVVETTGTGQISFTANRMALDTLCAVDAGTRAVSLLPRTLGQAINLGGVDSATQLGLSNAELDRITAGTLNIGDTTSGTITVAAAITRTAATVVNLASGGDIAITTSGINAAGGNVSLNAAGTLTAAGTGVDVSAGTLTFGSGTELALAINGATVNTGYQQLNALSAVNLAGASLTLSGSYMPLPGQTFVLVNNSGSGATTGAFSGLPEASIIDVHGVPMLLSYAGGTGNDVTLAYAKPVMTVTKATLSAAEGSTAVNSGTFSDLQGNVTLSANVGVVTPNVPSPSGTWSWSYVPLDGPTLPTTVTITATDDRSQTTSVSFALTTTNVTPVAQPQTLTVAEDSGPTSITLAATDPGLDTLTYLIVTAPAATKGSLGAVTGNAVNFTPAANFAGQATFTFKVKDSDDAIGNTATVTVNVTGVNDKPTFVMAASRSHPADFATAQSVGNWATAISDGDAEFTQTAHFSVVEQAPLSGIFAVNPLISDTGVLTYRTNGSPGTATLAVTLKDNGGGEDTSDVHYFTITVLDDSTKPTVTISSPAASATIPENTTTHTIPVTGTAADNKQVQKVQVQINGGAFADAVTTVASSGLTATYTTSVTPVPGVNTIGVRSIDALNNISTVVTRSFTYKVLRPLAVTITPANCGTVTYAPVLESNKAQIGVAYKLTATAKPGFFFDHWTAPGVVSPAAEAATLSVVMSEGLAITATFEESPFTAGSYNGLATPATGTTPSQYNLGFITGNLTTTGSFSGKVNFGGTFSSFTALFDRDTGNATGANNANPTLATLAYDLHVDLAEGNETITGTVSRMTSGVVTDVCDVDVDRATFSTTNKVPDRFLKTGNPAQNGTYTVVFPAIPDQPGLTNSNYPQGDGFGTLSVSPTGLVTLVTGSTLADGTAGTSSAPLSKTFRWPLALIIKSTSAVTGMTLGGMVQFDTGAADSDVTAASLKWFRPAKAGATHYPAGWPGGIETFLTGAKFVVPTGSSILPGLGATNTTTGNATLEFSDGLLSSPISKNVSIAPNNVVTNAPADASFKLTLTAASGVLGGTFIHTGSTTVIKGIILQKGTRKGGYGFFLSPVPSGGSGQSGGITLTPK